jgi:topoisomerase-4 subunit A
VRSAKGHEVDAAALAYREGDGAAGVRVRRSNQQVAFLDSSGRSYSTAAHTLPSARGNGEPLTGRFSPPAGAAFVGVAIGENDTRFLLAPASATASSPASRTSRPQQGRQGAAQSDKGAACCAGGGGRHGHRPRIAVTSAGHVLAFALGRTAGTGQGQGQQADRDPEGQFGGECVTASVLFARLTNVFA